MISLKKTYTTLKSKNTNRNIQISLGFLWVLDGLLQLQHQMFTSSFANNVITPAATGQPSIVHDPMILITSIILLHPAIFNVCFALIQLCIGGLILWQRTAYWGLLGSIFWGMGVWCFGEGLGGLGSGHALLLIGAPGAALLYVVIALAVLPSKRSKRIAKNLPASWLILAWLVLWLGGSLLQLMSGQGTASYLSSIIATNANGAPGWLASLDLITSHLIAHNGNWLVAAIVLLQVGIGVFVIVPGRIRILSVSFGVMLGTIFWFVGQNLGGYYTGLATDPNTSPLIILLGISVLAAKDFKVTFKPKFKLITEEIDAQES